MSLILLILEVEINNLKSGGMAKWLLKTVCIQYLKKESLPVFAGYR